MTNQKRVTSVPDQSADYAFLSHNFSLEDKTKSLGIVENDKANRKPNRYWDVLLRKPSEQKQGENAEGSRVHIGAPKSELARIMPQGRFLRCIGSYCKL